jgi:hypothetical protein
VTGDWELIIEGDWSLQGGTESYTCVVATVPEDMYIHAIRPIAPEGTHHTVLTVGASQPDGTFPCSASTNGQNMVYGSGVNTEARTFPEGVAVKLEAGEKLLLNLHLFNAFPEPLAGTSGIEVRRMDPAEVVHEATAILAGTLDLNIPPQSTVTETGYCTLPADATVFAVGPHMHQLGTHLTVSALTSSGEEVLHDGAYSFDDQQAFPVEPAVELSAGDQLRIDCTYTNPTNQQVGWGDSSNAEMCFATTFLYPASAGLGFICSN